MEDLLDELEDMGAEVDDTLDRLMGDEEMYIDYLKQLPDNENIHELRKAVDAKDYSKAEKEIHTLKGVALNLGLLPVVDVCMDMLLEYRGGNPEAASEMIGEVEKTFKEWCDVIQKYN